MDQKIKKLQSTTFSGRRFTRKQIAEIQNIAKRFSGLSRRELAHTICELYEWVTPAGTHKIHPCLNALEELKKQGIVILPAKQERKKRTQKQIAWTDRTNEQTSICCPLDQLMPIKIQKVIEKEDIECWNEFVDRYHYLGYKHPIGSNLRYYIIDRKERRLGCLLFSFAACSLASRDKYIGWEAKERKERLQLVLNNNRFLIFPWVNVKCLASKSLSLATKQIVNDWEEIHGYRPVLLETFVDPEKYSGTCYRAANWQYVGKTTERKSTGIKIEPLQLRLVKYVFSQTTYVLGTTLINQHYTIKQLADLYHSRWGIEELYKISKVLIDVEDFHAQTERGIKQELFAHFILITFSRIFANKAEDGFMTKQKSETANEVSVNMKNCLVTIARNLEGLFIHHAKIVKKTINTVMNSIAICRQKQRPGRSYSRISKKTYSRWAQWNRSIKCKKKKSSIQPVAA